MSIWQDLESSRRQASGCACEGLSRESHLNHEWSIWGDGVLDYIERRKLAEDPQHHSPIPDCGHSVSMCLKCMVPRLPCYGLHTWPAIDCIPDLLWTAYLTCYGLHTWPWARTNPLPLVLLSFRYLMAETRQFTYLPIILKLTAALLPWAADIHTFWSILWKHLI